MFGAAPSCWAGLRRTDCARQEKRHGLRPGPVTRQTAPCAPLRFARRAVPAVAAVRSTLRPRRGGWGWPLRNEPWSRWPPPEGNWCLLLINGCQPRVSRPFRDGVSAGGGGRRRTERYRRHTGPGPRLLPTAITGSRAPAAPAAPRRPSALARAARARRGGTSRPWRRERRSWCRGCCPWMTVTWPRTSTPRCRPGRPRSI